jgi:hypothetical protein
MIDVAVSAGGGLAGSYGVYNINSSPTMIDLVATISSGNNAYAVYNSGSSPAITGGALTLTSPNNNYGVYNYNSSPTLTGVAITASGGNGNYGMYSFANSSPKLVGVRATVSGGFSSYGMYNNESSATIRNSDLDAGGGTESYGIYNIAFSGGFNVTVDNSTLTGATNTIRNDSHFNTRVGTTKLSGGSAQPNVICAGVYDENYTFFPSTCP